MPPDIRTGFEKSRYKSEGGHESFGKTVRKFAVLVEDDKENGMESEESAFVGKGSSKGKGCLIVRSSRSINCTL